MREPYQDLYALFRHEPRAEEYFNSLPGYVQEQIGAQYRAVDSLERLQSYARKAEQHYPVEQIGGAVFLPRPGRF